MDQIPLEMNTMKKFLKAVGEIVNPFPPIINLRNPYHEVGADISAELKDKYYARVDGIGRNIPMLLKQDERHKNGTAVLTYDRRGGGSHREDNSLLFGDIKLTDKDLVDSFVNGEITYDQLATTRNERQLARQKPSRKFDAVEQFKL